MNRINMYDDIGTFLLSMLVVVLIMGTAIMCFVGVSSTQVEDESFPLSQWTNEQIMVEIDRLYSPYQSNLELLRIQALMLELIRRDVIQYHDLSELKMP